MQLILTLLTGLAKTWDGIVDIRIHAGRLYVASYGSNRIDVIDIATAATSVCNGIR